MLDGAGPHARELACDVARQDPPPGVSPEEAIAAVDDVVASVGDACPDCEPQRESIHHRE
jgi:hypothetical protein